MELPDHLQEMIEAQQKQETLKKFFVTPQRQHSSTVESSGSEQEEIDKIVLAYCMNPTVSFETRERKNKFENCCKGFWTTRTKRCESCIDWYTTIADGRRQGH